MYLPLCEVADAPFHIQGDELYTFDIFPVDPTVVGTEGDISVQERSNAILDCTAAGDPVTTTSWTKDGV